MFIDSDENLVIASLLVNVTMDTTMNMEPRRFGDKGKRCPHSQRPITACNSSGQNSNAKRVGQKLKLADRRS
jgi:hypothetical protein